MALKLEQIRDKIRAISNMKESKDISLDLRMFVKIQDDLKHDYTIHPGTASSDHISMKFALNNGEPYENVVIKISLYDDRADFIFDEIKPRSNEYLFSDPNYPNNLIDRIDKLVDSFINFTNEIRDICDKQ